MQRLNKWLGVLASTALLATGANALETDTDNDGFTDDVDNCILVPQVAGAGNDADGTFGDCDTDGDGIGNACDGDFDGNGLTVFADLLGFKTAFVTQDLVGDFNCNGFVNFTDLARFGEMFGTTAGPSSANCGIPDDPAVDDTAEWNDDVDGSPGGVVTAKVYMRGTFGPGLGFGVAEDGYNDFKRPSPPSRGIGADILTAQFAVYAGENKFKVADSDWAMERGNFTEALEVGSTRTLEDTTATCTITNAPISVPTDGCYRFDLDASNLLSLDLTMTEVIDGMCVQPTSIGGDELSNGERVYIRGSLINDWGASQGSNDFVNTGAGADQRETQFELTAGEYAYKVANELWTFERSTCGDADPPPQVLSPGATVQLVDLTQNSTVIFPKDACYQMELDITEGTDNPTLTLMEVAP